MNDYEVIIDTSFGSVRLVIQAENYKAAEEFANQMNQGWVTVNALGEGSDE